ncbi:MBL fold metallo-hydrolase [Bacteroides sp.]
MEIKILPANNGDCIIIYSDDRAIVIDGGYGLTYTNFLKPELESFVSQGGHVSLLVVTHIDKDHISGIIKMLREQQQVHTIDIHNIWHNSYRHLQNTDMIIVSDKEEDVNVHDICIEGNEGIQDANAVQGSTLASLILRSGIAWNSQFNGNAVNANIRQEIDIEDFSIKLLSPTTNCLEELKIEWYTELFKKGIFQTSHSNEYWDDAFEFLLSKDKPAFISQRRNAGSVFDMENLLKTKYIPDTSVTNGSSIAFVLEEKGKRMLFLGDSASETIVEQLKKIYSDAQRPIWFDMVKLAHHGSFNNSCPEFFNLVDSDKWVISTDGSIYDHPDQETLAYIIALTRKNRRTIYFNYSLQKAMLLASINNLGAEIVTPKEQPYTIITL